MHNIHLHDETRTTTRFIDKPIIITPHTLTTLNYITTSNTHTQETNTFNNTNYTTDINTKPDTINNAQIKTNMKHIHTTIVSSYLNIRNHTKITITIPLNVHRSESTLPRATHRNLAQIRTNNVSPYIHI